MDQVHVIRHKVLVEGQSARSVARHMRVSRNTVRKYLLESAPKRQESGPRARPVLEAVVARMETLLEQWSVRSTAKQRVTGSRLHQELVEEGFQVGITTVRSYLRERRRQAAEVFVPLVHRPGEGRSKKASTLAKSDPPLLAKSDPPSDQSSDARATAEKARRRGISKA